MILFDHQYGNLVHALRNNIQVLESLGKQVEHRAIGIEQAFKFTLENRKRLSITSPTGKGIRMDSQGDGHFKASRGKRVHLGFDFEGEPKQDIWQPLNRATLTRIVFPYADDTTYTGIELVGDIFIVHLLYVFPDHKLLGTTLNRGDVVGIMQDISRKYGKGMVPHVHMNVYINPEVLLKPEV